VARLSQRLGLTKHKDPGKIEQDLMNVLPQEAWTIWSHLLISHGRRRCHARNPKCATCELAKICPFVRTANAGTYRRLAYKEPRTFLAAPNR